MNCARTGRREVRPPATRALVQLGLRAADFDYELPQELIAQRPPAQRSAGRMLVLDRRRGSWEDAAVRDLPGRLSTGDCLVVNNSKVLAARLRGRRLPAAGAPPGSAAEILVLSPEDAARGLWRALVRPGRRLPAGAAVEVAGTRIVMHGSAGPGVRVVEFPGMSAAQVRGFLRAAGRIPLPPYVRRDDDAADRDRYQTVFAAVDGSVAAPTAGLHFDRALLEAIGGRGAAVAAITLHVGLGTFQPVTAERVADHRMHAECFEVPPDAAKAIRDARRVLAVGTTSVRTLEAAARSGGGAVRPLRGETDLFITPGFRFQAVDALLTNFHLPRSTLLMLVAAFAGPELVREAYAHAVRERYRFYSYGDCMLIV